MNLRPWIIIGIACLLRLTIFTLCPWIPDYLTAQVEISTPISSFKRLQEGLFLYTRGASPYDGGVFHQAPLLLAVFQILPPSLVYTALDALNAVSLYKIAEGLRIPSTRFKQLDPSLIAAAYLFNPLTVISCLGRTTSVFTNASVVQAMLGAISGNGFQAMFATGVGTYLSLYPALLLPPIIQLLHQSQSTTHTPTLRLVGIYMGSLAVLLALTPIFEHDFQAFLKSCYGAQITFTDLTPNIGLWWYFFVEIFDAFRGFFIGVFWLHLVAYVGGLAFRLPKQPVFVITCLSGLTAIFKPYPSISDVSLYLALLPMYQHVLPLTRYLFVAAAVILYSTLLGPAFYYLWIYAGSGNANFFYAITLVWCLGLTMLLGDSLHAVLRDEWEVERPDMKGKPASRI